MVQRRFANCPGDEQMTGNDGTGNIAERDNWQTPQWLFNKLHKQYSFEFDCCASKNNTKCDTWHDNFLMVGNEEAGLEDECCWMNPPFSKAYQMFRHFFDFVDCGVCIYRCDNLETALYQDIILKHATWILIPKGRISYEGKAGKGARFPSALIGFNIETPKEVKGTILLINNNN